MMRTGLEYIQSIDRMKLIGIVYNGAMNLRDLRYLVALADERHFGRAAEKSFVSQPTLSAQIRKLEEYLGVPLVERQPKVSLTPAGERIVERARRLLRSGRDCRAGEDRSRSAVGTPEARADPDRQAVPAATRRDAARNDLPRLKLMLYEYQTPPVKKPGR
jgi:LysR family hydrogen peroxide-inducible transcriptional activator